MYGSKVDLWSVKLSIETDTWCMHCPHTSRCYEIIHIYITVLLHLLLMHIFQPVLKSPNIQTLLFAVVAQRYAIGCQSSVDFIHCNLFVLGNLGSCLNSALINTSNIIICLLKKKFYHCNMINHDFTWQADSYV